MSSPFHIGVMGRDPESWLGMCKLLPSTAHQYPVQRLYSESSRSINDEGYGKKLDCFVCPCRHVVSIPGFVHDDRADVLFDRQLHDPVACLVKQVFDFATADLMQPL